MSISDEYLKQLKTNIRGVPENMAVALHGKQFRELLGRLEAAEAVCESSRIHGGPCSDPNALPNQCNLCADYDAWRKAAGKS